MLPRTLLPLTLMLVLTAATPSDVVESPTEIRLWFTGIPEEKTTSIRLIGANDEPVPTPVTK
jgi:hypothetical protein